MSNFNQDVFPCCRKLVTVGLVWFFIFFSSGCDFKVRSVDRVPIKVSDNTPIILSQAGSSRATAYELSNKILSDSQYVYASFLAYEENENIIKLIKINQDGLSVEKEISIGTGDDNHIGASILRDSKRNFHLFYGAHNDYLKYRYNMDGENLNKWSEEISIANGLTYPSAIILSNDDILVTARLGFNVLQQDPWEYILYRIRDGVVVSEKSILLSRRHDDDFVNRYIHYFAQLVVGNDDSIHLGFLLHERSSDDPVNPANGLGYGIGYLKSNDMGETWYDSSNSQIVLPGNVNDYSLVEGEKDAGEVIDDYRSVSIDIDPITQKAVIAFVKYNFQNKIWSTWIARKKSSGWKISKITEGLYKISLHISGDGTIYIMGEKLSDPTLTVEKGWSNPDTKMVVMVSVDDGLTFNEILLSNTIEGPHWYPSLPKTVAPSQTTAPFYMYMTGNNDSSTVTFGRLPLTK